MLIEIFGGSRMRIMVFDVPAESGGALTILHQHYNAAADDKNTEWIFIVSTPNLKDRSNIKVLKYPWIKKSWFHRLYFDRFIANKIIKKYKVDKVLSLQNVVIPKVKLEQILYLHQSLPFAEKRYSIFESFKLWVYQNIIGKMIFKSIKKADKVIVQTKWIMDKAIEKTNEKKEKFLLKKPKINVKVKEKYIPDYNKITTFFYPASGFIYKNHKVIVMACKLLKYKKIDNYKVVFTLRGDENKDITKLKKIVEEENLPIEFIGTIDINSVYEYYSKSILIFPSYIESFGLPLLEGKMHLSPIIASNCAFSHEILDDYNGVEFFEPNDAKELSNKLLMQIQETSIK